MADEEVGYLTGSVRPSRFDLKLTDPKVGNASFIKLKHPVHGWVLARISSIRTYLDDFDEDETKAHAYTVGFRKSGSVLQPKTPFRPNEKVYLADTKLISEVLNLGGMGKKGNIYLGFLDGHQELPVYLDMEATIGKHMSVLAKTGAGKSYTVAVILEEILNTGLSTVIIDPHGEYSSLCVENDDYDAMARYNVQIADYSDKVVEYTTNKAMNEHAQKLTLRADFTMEELLELIPIRLTEKEKSILYSALSDMDDGYTLDDLRDRIEEEPTKFKWKILDGIAELMKSGVFDGYPTPYSKLVAENTCSVINLKGCLPEIQQLIVARLTRDLFELRKLGRVPRLFYLVEESHNFCPERGFGDVMSSSILRTIAGEGRKFGFHLCVVSQRPARVDKNVLSQCTTQVILKVTNPNDLKAIRQSIEGFTSGMEEEIQQLPVGHALVVCENLKQPVTVDVRCRQTKHGARPSYDSEGKVARPIRPPQAKKIIEAKRKGKKPPEKEVQKPKTLFGKIMAVFIAPESGFADSKPISERLKGFFISPDDEA